MKTFRPIARRFASLLVLAALLPAWLLQPAAVSVWHCAEKAETVSIAKTSVPGTKKEKVKATASHEAVVSALQYSLSHGFFFFSSALPVFARVALRVQLPRVSFVNTYIRNIFRAAILINAP